MTANLAGLLAEPTVFFDRHWGRTPVRLESVKAPPDLLTERQILDTIDCGLLTVPYLAVLDGPTPVPAGEITRTRTVVGNPVAHLVDPQAVAQRYAAGATIVLNEPDQWHAPTHDLLRAVGDTFRSGVRSAVVAMPPAGRAVRAHPDDVHLFAVQLAGQSTWRVQGTDGTVPIRVDDLLYVPPGARRVVEAGADGSLYLALLVREPSAEDIARSVIATVVGQLRAAADHDSHHLQPLPDKAAQVRQRLSAALTGVDPAGLAELASLAPLVEPGP